MYYKKYFSARGLTYFAAIGMGPLENVFSTEKARLDSNAGS